MMLSNYSKRSLIPRTPNSGARWTRYSRPNNYLASTLKAVVKTIKIRSQLGLRRQTFFVSYGGWDHHGELLNTEASMFSTLDTAIGAYQRALEILDLQNDVVTFSASDFGRTLRSNGRGTDHAWGSNAMVFGGKVDGGKIFGSYPDLTLDGPDDVGRGGRLLPSIAADLYFAELLRWFGVSSGEHGLRAPQHRQFLEPSFRHRATWIRPSVKRAAFIIAVVGLVVAFVFLFRARNNPAGTTQSIKNSTSSLSSSLAPAGVTTESAMVASCSGSMVRYGLSHWPNTPSRLKSRLCASTYRPAYSRHMRRNSAALTLLVFPPNSFSTFVSIGSPWQSQPGTYGERNPAMVFDLTIMSFRTLFRPVPR